jgi:anti-sigma regulatory factor (Ser/Thr protein kinase)
MSEVAVAVDQQVISFVVPSVPESVRIARFHVRAALGFHGLDEYADVAVTISSELVTNAIRHVREDPGETIGITLAHVWGQVALAIMVTDSSPDGPVLRETSVTNGRGHGLQVVEALSDHWGWHPEPAGKAVYAVIVKEG